MANWTLTPVVMMWPKDETKLPVDVPMQAIEDLKLDVYASLTEKQLVAIALWKLARIESEIAIENAREWAK